MRGKRLIEERDILLHRLFAKLLFVRKFASPDIHPNITFIMTWVRDPVEDGW